MAATAGRSGTILIYRLKDGEVARSMKGLPLHRDEPDGNC